MSLKEIFHHFLKNDTTIKQLKRKILELEKNINQYQGAHQPPPPQKQETPPAKQEESPINRENEAPQPPIIIEKLNVEKLVVDKVELNNNFGQLGIKELKGRLNIGATYGEGSGLFEHIKKDSSPEKKSENPNKDSTSAKDIPETKVNVRGRKPKPE